MNMGTTPACSDISFSGSGRQASLLFLLLSYVSLQPVPPGAFFPLKKPQETGNLGVRIFRENPLRQRLTVFYRSPPSFQSPFLFPFLRCCGISLFVSVDNRPTRLFLPSLSPSSRLLCPPFHCISIRDVHMTPTPTNSPPPYQATSFTDSTLFALPFQLYNQRPKSWRR